MPKRLVPVITFVTFQQKETVDIIRRAKAKGIDVTCETGPHYLVLSDADLQEDGRFKMNPPLRDAKDRDALIAGIQDGTIDMIATDHAPTVQKKRQGAWKKALSASSAWKPASQSSTPIL